MARLGQGTGKQKSSSNWKMTGYSAMPFPQLQPGPAIATVHTRAGLVYSLPSLSLLSFFLISFFLSFSWFLSLRNSIPFFFQLLFNFLLPLYLFHIFSQHPIWWFSQPPDDPVALIASGDLLQLNPIQSAPATRLIPETISLNLPLTKRDFNIREVREEKRNTAIATYLYLPRPLQQLLYPTSHLPLATVTTITTTTACAFASATATSF